MHLRSSMNVIAISIVSPSGKMYCRAPCGSSIDTLIIEAVARRHKTRPNGEGNRKASACGPHSPAQPNRTFMARRYPMETALQIARHFF